MPFEANAQIMRIGIIKINFSSFSIKIFFIAGSSNHAMADVARATTNEKIIDKIILFIKDFV